MREIGYMFFPFIKHTGFDFAFSTIAKFCSHCPSVMIQQLTPGAQTNDTILAKFILVSKTSYCHRILCPWQKLLYQKEKRPVLWHGR